MKKIALTAICAVSMAGAAFAQGTVNYAAFVPTYISFQTNMAVSPLFGGEVTAVGGGVTGLAAQGFYYELLFSASGATQPSSLAALSDWTDSTYYANNSTASAGRVTAGNGAAGSAVAGMAVGTTYSTLVVGWSANLGTAWSDVLAKLNNWDTAGTGISGNAFFGMTSVGAATPAGTSAPGVGIFGAGSLINSPNTQLYFVPVPEPATMALAALGGASLLLFRRRK
jgi:hypothetical protein